MAPPKKSSSAKGTSLAGGKYTVGKLIGEGGFGSVHAVLSADGRETEWAVKLTAVPTKTTKKGNSIAEIAHRRLWAEKLLYTQHFIEYCGSLLPRLPRRTDTDGLDSFIDNANGYRCLIMERMDCQLFDALPAFVKSCKKHVLIGPLAIKLMNIVEAFHKQQQLILDVKPENMMVCHGEGSLADLIRIVDLGLVKCYLGPSGHKLNEGIADVNGTPMYASLNVHDLQSPSRRDDVEAMLYLTGELVIRIKAIADGKVAEYETDDHPSYLPWSQEKSDDAVGRKKEEQVSNIDSEYYSRMPASAAKALMQAWQMVREYKYKEEPNYEALRALLGDLKVSIPLKKAASTRAKKVTKAPTRASKRVTRNSSESPVPVDEDAPRTRRRRACASKNLREDDGLSDDDAFPAKMAKTKASDDVSMMDVDEDSFVEGESFHTASSVNDSFHTTATSMFTPDRVMVDVEDMDDHDPASDFTVIRGGATGVKLKISLPGGKGETSIFLVKGETESIVLGSNPTSNDDVALLEVDDAKLQPSHVQLTFNTDRSVEVKDLSGGKTFCEKMKIPRSGTVSFVGQEITFGDTSVEVSAVRNKDYSLAAAAVEVENKGPAKPISRRASRSSRAMAETDANVNTPVVDSVAPAKKPSSKRKITVKVEGGKPFVLQQGVCESCIVGTSPSTTKGVKAITLPRKKGIKASHARLDLIVNNNVMSVKVTDLKSGGDTFIDQKKIGTGKNTMVFRGGSIKVGDLVLDL